MQQPVFQETIMNEIAELQKRLSELNTMLQPSNDLSQHPASAVRQLPLSLTGQHSSLFKFIKQGDKYIHTFCDGELLKFIGLSREKVLGQSFHSFVPSFLYSYLEEKYEQAWKGEPVQYSHTLNGRNILVVLQPMFQNGKVIEVIGSSVDITIPLILEQNLAESEARFKSLFDNHIDSLFTVDVNGKITSQNNTAKKIVQMFCPQLTLNLNEVADFEETPYIINGFQQAKKGETITFETSLSNRSSALQLLITFIPMFEKGLITGVYGIARDITGINSLIHQLQESEERYKLIAENTSDLIMVIDRKGIASYASPSYEKVLGLPPNTLIGKKAASYLHPDDEASAIKWILHSLETKKDLQMELRKRHVSGHYILMEAKCTPVMDENGNVHSIVITCRDITERKNTEELLRKTEKLSVLGELAAGVAHEIRNPLTSLRGFTQLIKADKGNNLDYLNIMLSELDRINNIVGELLLIAKPQVESFSTVELEPLVKHVTTLLDTQAILNNVLIQTHIETGIPAIYGVENQLKQVFINLLKNAIEAMPHGGSVNIRAHTDSNERVCITFADTGVGIPAERMATLGEPFYTTKEKGTGLGLMICFRIIENHKGKLVFHSEPQKGTIARITLPYCQTKE